MGVVAGALAAVLAAISAAGGSSARAPAATPRTVAVTAPAAEATTAATAAQTRATGAPLTLSGTHKRRVMGGRMEVNANEYNSSAALTIRNRGRGPNFTIIRSQINQQPVGAYPSLFVGRHGDFVTRHDPFPLRLSSIRPGEVITGVHSITPRSACRGRWADFYDIFLTAGAHANPFTTTREELEIWQNAAKRSAGGTLVAKARLDGRLYDVFDHVTKRTTQVAYVPVKFPSDSFHGDLRAFIRDSVRRGYAHPNWFLADIEHGFEINSGNVVGLGDRKFSVLVHR